MYEDIDALRDEVERIAAELPPAILENYNADFDITYSHESTAIEGNTLSLAETKLLLEDGVSVGGKKLREIYEVVNHGRAFARVRQLVHDGRPLDETTLKDLHALLMENIMAGGAYRAHGVRIVGASHRPPDAYELREKMAFYFADMPANRERCM